MGKLTRKQTLHTNDQLSRTHHFDKGTIELGTVIRSGLFSQCCIMRNTYLTSHTGHYFDVITGGKKLSLLKKKKKVHVSITEPKVILGQATQKKLIFFKKYLAFSPLALLPG